MLSSTSTRSDIEGKTLKAETIKRILQSHDAKVAFLVVFLTSPHGTLALLDSGGLDYGASDPSGVQGRLNLHDIQEGPSFSAGTSGSFVRLSVRLWLPWKERRRKLREGDGGAGLQPIPVSLWKAAPWVLFESWALGSKRVR